MQFLLPQRRTRDVQICTCNSYTGAEKKEYFSSANVGTLTIVHIEGNKGLENLEQIVSLDGIDIVFLGPYDLSQSCGFPGQTNHPEVVNKMKQAVMLAKKHNKIIGTFVKVLKMPISGVIWVFSTLLTL